jgi:tetratricopeptide (TPR) repeat protein
MDKKQQEIVKKARVKEEEILRQARDLYNKGQYRDAIEVIEKQGDPFGVFSRGATIEAFRLLGWAYYYKGIKGPEKEKPAQMRLAEQCFVNALDILDGWKTLSPDEIEQKISVFNGYPLVLWILGQKKEALEFNAATIKEFPNRSSVWNTRSILFRWAGKHEESVAVCKKVSEIAATEENFRTAGHGKHNKGDALRTLGRIDEAKEVYHEALNFYKIFQKKTGESAKMHIEGCVKNLNNLKNNSRLFLFDFCFCL